MRKATKGAIAAAAGGALLLGGAGTLAFWTDTATTPGGTLTAGSLSLTPDTCADDWVLDTGEDVAGEVFDPATDTLVPGDVLTRECTFTIGAVGNHLRATVAAAPPPQIVGNPSLTVSAAVVEVDGAPATEFTEANNGDSLTVGVTVTFDSGAGNDTQGLVATLNDITITATQVHN
jgi:alternate signal-mediated exported protein